MVAFICERPYYNQGTSCAGGSTVHGLQSSHPVFRPSHRRFNSKCLPASGSVASTAQPRKTNVQGRARSLQERNERDRQQGTRERPMGLPGHHLHRHERLEPILPVGELMGCVQAPEYPAHSREAQGNLSRHSTAKHVSRGWKIEPSTTNVPTQDEPIYSGT